MRQITKERLRAVALTILVASATINVWLAAAPHVTRSEVESKQEATPRIAIPVGSTAPEISVVAGEGSLRTISLNRKPTVLYVLRPGCQWCERNTENMRALWKQAAATYQFIGLSVKGEGLEDYLRKYRLPFPVHVASEATMAAFGLGTTPSTIVIGPEGKITNRWNGGYRSALPAIERFFAVKLPGLTDK